MRAQGAMELGLEILCPARFISFVLPNSQPPAAATEGAPSLYLDNIRVAVLDSPLPPPPLAASTATILVPRGRHDDWIFSTAAGHLQLLLSFSRDLPISRLILIGDLPSSSSSPAPWSRDQSDLDAEQLSHFQESLLPLVLALCPKAAFSCGIPEVPFLSFEDEASRIVPVETLVGPVVGEMLVEDVDLDRSPPERRRRLRFKRMPDLLQTQVRLLPLDGGATFRPEPDSLVQPYLGPMIAGLSLASSAVVRRAQSGKRPRALCIGVGGGALLMCLRMKLNLDVLGIEADEVVLDVARKHFGLVEDEFLKTCVGNAIDFIKTLHGPSNGRQELGGVGVGVVGLPEDYGSGFDAVMVDLDSEDGMSGVFAPPLEVVEREFLVALRSVLHDGGVAVMNVVIPHDRHFYETLIDDIKKVFDELYELDVGNDGENCVLIATASPVEAIHSEECSAFIEDLKRLVGETRINSIKRL